MRGVSKESLAGAREALAGVADAAGALGSELFSVARLLDTNGTLRRALTDPSRRASDKSGMVEQLLRDRVSDAAMSVVSVAAAARWSAGRDLPDALDDLSVDADVRYADTQGRLDDVEDELFRLERIVARERALADRIGDRSVGVESRQELVRGLLAGRADATTVRLAQRAVVARGRGFTGCLTAYQARAAAYRNSRIATVRVATDLTEPERTRLAAALSRQYGRTVQVNVIVDPDVIGGVRVHIGDEVIDGTVAAKLGEAHRRIAG